MGDNEVVAALKRTSKGQLNYDTEANGLNFLNEWTSPTRLSNISAHLVISPENGKSFQSSDFNGLNHVPLSDDSKTNSAELLNRKNVRATEDIGANKLNRTGKQKVLTITIEPDSQKRRISLEVKKISRTFEMFPMEEEIQKIAEAFHAMKQNEFSRKDNELQEDVKRRVSIVKKNLEKKTNDNKNRAEASLKAKNEEALQKQQVLQKRHEHHAKELLKRNYEADREIKKQEEKRREDEHQKCQVVVKKMHQEAESMSNKMNEMLSSCNFTQHLPPIATQAPKFMTQICEKLKGMAGLQHDLTPKLVSTGKAWFDEMKKIIESTAVQIDEANRKGAEELQSQAEKAAVDAAAAAKEAAAAAAEKSAIKPPTAGSTSSQSAFMPAECEQWYEALQAKLDETEKSCEELVHNSQYKKYKLQFSKAVNTPINAIAPTSGSHLRDKLQKLCNLLSGKSVEITGGQRLSTKDHQAGLIFCMDLMAEKLIQQGGEQVSSNPESAYPFASVAVGIWFEYREVGELMLAHLHKKCPYTVPFYIPQGNEKREAYYSRLGYNIEDDGEIEKQDKFLKRMTGYIILYAAIIISTTPNTPNHPHGIQNAWLWLSRVMSLDPRPDITATVLYHFIQVTGYALSVTYGRQFFKLIQYLHDVYLPKILAITMDGASGPVTRLQGFLQDLLRTRKILPPKGLLQAHFWTR